MGLNYAWSHHILHLETIEKHSRIMLKKNVKLELTHMHGEHGYALLIE
jgi:hypothetical protein